MNIVNISIISMFNFFLIFIYMKDRTLIFYIEILFAENNIPLYYFINFLIILMLKKSLMTHQKEREKRRKNVL